MSVAQQRHRMPCQTSQFTTPLRKTSVRLGLRVAVPRLMKRWMTLPALLLALTLGVAAAPDDCEGIGFPGPATYF
jgi:hypothetical protein